MSPEALIRYTFYFCVLKGFRKVNLFELERIQETASKLSDRLQNSSILSRIQSQINTLSYSLNPKIRRKKILRKTNFQFELLCEEVFWEKFDNNASPYFRVKTVAHFTTYWCFCFEQNFNSIDLFCTIKLSQSDKWAESFFVKPTQMFGFHSW